MDLITERWLPVITATGQQNKISPLQLWDNNIIDVAYPRPDFQGAAWQFLIGLLQTAIGPEDESGWRDVWRTGLTEQAWQQALAPLVLAMQFGSQKPAFLQSFESLDADNGPIAGLLIDSPGGNTLKLNKDHFIKRDACERMCPHCAVMALFTVQTNSPAGGAGYRVGMRGGGPLTTLVVPQEHSLPLWKKLWLNVTSGDVAAQPEQMPLIFPWLTATCTSERAGNSVTPENAHPLQAYWSMPRRIELDFSHTEAGECSLCGTQHHACLREIRSKNYGVQYDGWLHPLSPYRQSIKDNTAPWLSLKGQSGGLSYKDWLGLSLESEDKFNLTRPAGVVRSMDNRRKMPATYLWCFGFDMDNAKARCWYQHRLPLVLTDDPARLKALLRAAVDLSIAALSVLKKYLKNALYAPGSDVSGDFGIWDTAWWRQTEAQFRSLLSALADDPAQQQPQTHRAFARWANHLLHQMLVTFDDTIFTNSASDSAVLRRQLVARQALEKEYLKLKVRKEFISLAAAPQEEGNV